MPAAFYDNSRTMRFGECEPIKPGLGQVSVKVSFCGICGTDVHIYHGKMDQRVKVPHIMGHEASGIISAVGDEVKGISVGDRVTVRPLDYCGNCPACRAGHSHICQNLKFIGIDTPGAFQSEWTVPAHTIHRLPDNVSFRLGALIEPLAVACHDVRIGQVSDGEFVAVLGGGPIGMLIAMVASQMGAEVLVSEISPYRIQLARDLGFDAVNPNDCDLQAYVEDKTGGAGADVVFEVTAGSAGAKMMTRLPRTRGRIVAVGIFAQPVEVDLFRFFWRELRLFGARVYETEDFDRAIELAAMNTLPLERLISAEYSLDNVEAGFERIEHGSDVMKVLINCNGEE